MLDDSQSLPLDSIVTDPAVGFGHRDRPVIEHSLKRCERAARFPSLSGEGVATEVL